MAGGQKRGRTQRKHFKQGRENVWKHNNKKTGPQEDPSAENPNPNSNPSWEPFATKNLAFEEYYKEQCVVPEEEWDEFMSLLRKPLPASFRINSSGQFFQDIRSQLENDFMKSLEADVNNEYEMEAIRPLPWYPGNLAWHLNYSRMQLRKNQTLERFHEFLKQENEIGNITRQESVSMVPPLFLDVLPDHYVLDMCAAPGSKTFQLLEIMHQSAKLGLLPNGLVIANDVDVQRCNLLIHQTKRMCNANLIVTNHEAQHFPNCHVIRKSLETFNMKDVNGELTSSLPSHGPEEMSNEELTSSLSSHGPEEMWNSQLLFDRVLCDVPCSGDGTLRKAPDIWRKWNAGMGNGLHRLQVQIALRGIALLKVGGRMVYSTCSMNPVENEAVVAEVLRKCGGSVELLDVSTELPELSRRPGLKKWKVRDKGLWLASYKDVPTNRKGGIVPSMFPSGQSCEVNKILCSNMKVDMEPPENDGMGENLAKLSRTQEDNTDCGHNCEGLENAATLSGNTEALTKTERTPSSCEPAEGLKSNQEEEVSNLPLHHCIRILPHDQNSGAFFIAVLRMISPLNGLMENHSTRYKKRRAVPANTSEIHDGLDKLETSPFEDVQGQHQHVLAEAASESVEIDKKVDKNGVSSLDNESEGARACILENNMEGIKGTKGGFQIQGKWRGVDPVVFLQDDTIINSIKTFYGINQSFPLDGHLVTRNSDSNHVKRIYYISKSVHDVLKLNFKVGQQLKITSLGLKMFERQTSRDGSSPCAFRISSEGLPLLLPYISKQILTAPLTDFQHLLQYRVIKFPDFVDSNLGEKASKLMAGCCVVVLNKGDQPTTDTITVDASTIAIGCWKGISNLSVMVSQVDSQELLERLSVRFGVKVGEGSTPSSKVNNKIIHREGDTLEGSMDIELKDDSEEPPEQEAAVS